MKTMTNYFFIWVCPVVELLTSRAGRIYQII
jgi:hypothetical protein